MISKKSRSEGWGKTLNEVFVIIFIMKLVVHVGGLCNLFVHSLILQSVSSIGIYNFRQGFTVLILVRELFISTALRMVNKLI